MRFSIFLYLSLTSGLLAQGQPQAASVPAGAIFHATSQVVLVPVSVKEKDGKPIEGLTARDFTITENGVPQVVASCDYQKIDDAAAVAEPVPARETSDVPAIIGNVISSGPTGRIRYRDHRLLALYFDLSAMSSADKYRAIDSARRFLREKMGAADLIAVMAFSQGVMHVMSDFTSNREVLDSIIGSLAKRRDFDDNADFGQDDEEFNVFTTARQLSALQTAVSMLGHLSEKKALIYFASGVKFAGVQNQAQMLSVTNAAVRANVAIFPVDARGLVAMAPMGDASKASPGGIGMYTGATAMARTNSFELSQDALYALGADTGGKALLDSNDLALGIVQAQRAFSSYYVLSYYPANTALDGKFRRIVVTLKEYTTAKLDYRRGYFGGKEFGKFNNVDKERQLEEALMLGDPITDLTIAMEVNYFQLNRAEYYVPMMLKVPGSELVLAHKGGAERTVIDFIGEIKDESKRTVRNIRDKVDIKLSGATAAELSGRPIEYDCGYTLLPGEYTIKVLARDNETGRIGTYIGRFVIPNLNKEEQGVPISSVVLGSQRVGLRDAIYTAGKDKEQIANPLVQDGQKLIPSVTRVFRQSANLFVYLQAYQQTAATAQPMVGYVSFYRDSVKAFETPPIEFSESMDNKLKTTPLKFSIPLGELHAGKYDCQVSVIDWDGRKASFWQTPVLVVQ